MERNKQSLSNKAMEVQSVLCMNGGEGVANYAESASVPRRVLSVTRPVVEKTIEDLVHSTHITSSNAFTMADLGCASGPNTMSVISTVVGALKKLLGESKSQASELQVFLNDLPRNDFNSVFRSVPTYLEQLKACEDNSLSCYISGVPGSFYNRLFPRKSLHFVHACYSVHWLSKVPTGVNDDKGMLLNKGKIYISKSSPPCVSKAYLEQFKEDFTCFLRHRSEEMVQDGRMVLILQSRDGSDPSSKEATYPFDILADALLAMVSEGLIQQEKVDTCDMPYYTPSPEEVQDIVLKEGSFILERIEKFAVDRADESMQDMWVKAENVEKSIRCFTEPIMSYHFGEENLDRLYDKLTHLLVKDFAKEIIKIVNVFVVLKRKN